MTKRITLVAILLISFLGNINAQSTEGEIFEITKRVKIFLPETGNAKLEGVDRYIQVGFLGNPTDIQNLVGYMDRFIVNDKDMTLNVAPTISEEMIDYYKFYLNPLYDANDFQKMLVMLGVKKYTFGSTEYDVNSFSNTVYASIKTKNSK